QSAQSLRQMRSIPHCSKAVFYVFFISPPQQVGAVLWFSGTFLGIDSALLPESWVESKTKT
ncbi:MAG: hypothetical protein SPE96_02015, partial [Sodaliphilus sp.]|nr:hypothetical protein [Sodaliphilus sp.]